MESTKLSRREFGLAAAAAAITAAQASAARAANETRVARSLPLRWRGGVALAGAEFGTDRADFSNVNPGLHGVDYQYPLRQTIEYFSQRNLGLLRIPFRWERIQPRLHKSLDSKELARLRNVVEMAGACNASVVLDLHNYARYRLVHRGNPRSVIVDEVIDGQVLVPRSALADLWRRLAAEFANSSAVVGLGLMNEPHDLESVDWKQISQTAVSAIRQVNQQSYVIVPGDGWSNAHRFEELNGPRAWIQDPAGRVLYEAHCYFDADASGKYQRSFVSELQDDPHLAERGAARLRIFFDWCRRNQVEGFVGEIGIPGDDIGWQQVLIGALREIDRARASTCYWAAGEWWNDYPLSVQPRNEWRDPAPQEQLLRKYLTNRGELGTRVSQASSHLTLS